MITIILVIVGASIVGVIVGAVCFSTLMTRLDLSDIASEPTKPTRTSTQPTSDPTELPQTSTLPTLTLVRTREEA